MKKLSVFLLIMFCSMNIQALGIQYDGVDDEGNPLSSVITVLDFYPNGLIHLGIEGGGLYIDPSSGAVTVDPYTYFGSDADPASGLLGFAEAWGIYTEPMLYIFTSVVLDLTPFDPSYGVSYAARIFALRLTAGGFALENMYETFYLSNAGFTTANVWLPSTPSVPVIYRLVP